MTVSCAMHISTLLQQRGTIQTLEIDPEIDPVRRASRRGVVYVTRTQWDVSGER
jgi:hypothetical protein